MLINKIRPIIYVSGPFSTFGDPKKNVEIATKYSNNLRKIGFAVISPHNNSGVPEDDMTWGLFMQEDYSLILMSHGLFMLPDWDKSKGAVIEHEWAKELGIPIFYSDTKNSEEFVEISQYFFNENSVWEKSPNQVHEFLKIIFTMFRLHLKKNADYSPRNVLGVGEVGLATRLFDKNCRLMNLIGFNTDTGEYSTPKSAKNESIEDTLLDQANYSIIWLIYRMKKWGR